MKLANAKRKVSLLAPYLDCRGSVLDFGCGDMTFAQELHASYPSLHVTALDVVDFGIRHPGIIFRKYRGESIPFQKSTFDTVISWHVLHHTTRPTELLADCFRVAKNTVIFVEPVYRGWWDIPGMRCMDWVFNIWKDKSISMPFAFASEKEWKKEVSRSGWSCEQVIDVELLPKWLPTGRSLLFVCRKNQSFLRRKKHSSG